MAEQSGGGGNGGNSAASAGNYTALAGTLVAALGAYYEAKSAKFMAKSQALSLEYEGTLAKINARQAEVDAQAVADAGRYEKMRLTFAAGAEIASMQADQASSGAVVGSGNAAEAVASRRLMQQMDERTLAINTSRDIAAARNQAVNARSAARLNEVSAANLRRQSASISPGAAFHTGLLGSGNQAATSIANYYTYRGRR